MNKKLLFTLPISALVTSCAGFIPGAVPGCHSPTIPEAHNCHNSATPRNTLTINTERRFMEATPPVACVDKGATVNINVTPANGRVTVISVPKDPADGWIYANNIADPNLMQISVPTSAVGDSDHEYLIIASNGKCLDPKFHVD